MPSSKLSKSFSLQGWELPSQQNFPEGAIQNLEKESHYQPLSLLPSRIPCGVGHMPLRIPGLVFILLALFGDPMMRTGSVGHHGITSCWLERYFFNETMYKGTVRIYFANTLYLRDLLMLNRVPVQGSGLGAYYSWLRGLELCVWVLSRTLTCSHFLQGATSEIQHYVCMCAC